MPQPIDVDDLRARLIGAGYVADAGLATALACAVSLERAILLEGDAGVGKTDAARALASVFDARLLRLQCYEGLDLAAAAYDWNYGKQLLAIRAAEASHERTPDLYADDFLIRRPLLAALGAQRERGIVRLIDEIDRADDEFEAFLLEFLGDFAISIPERGTIAAVHRPIVVLTSNRTRDLHDALKRRCLYHWIDYPQASVTAEIIRRRVPESARPLADLVSQSVARLRTLELQKLPGVAEAISWAHSLDALGLAFDASAADVTLGSVIKYRQDRQLVLGRGLDWLVGSHS